MRCATRMRPHPRLRLPVRPHGIPYITLILREFSKRGRSGREGRSLEEIIGIIGKECAMPSISDHRTLPTMDTTVPSALPLPCAENMGMADAWSGRGAGRKRISGRLIEGDSIHLYPAFPPSASLRRPWRNGMIKTLKGPSHICLIFQGENGAAEWNRTTDLTLTKGMLYRLSYGSTAAGPRGSAREGALYATAVPPMQPRCRGVFRTAEWGHE